MQNLFEKWLINNNRPKRYAKTIVTISNDLKKVGYLSFDLFSINDSDTAKQIRDDYFNIDIYFGKNSRGNNMYSSAFDRYIEFLEDISDTNIVYPDDIEDSSLFEGLKKQITVNTYERNSKARQECIKHYGARCIICGFNFEEKYGEIGKGFIHVHHIKPLSEINEKYEINPIEDLRPVCPNCHAMIHKRKPAYSIEEIQSLLVKDDL